MGPTSAPCLGVTGTGWGWGTSRGVEMMGVGGRGSIGEGGVSGPHLVPPEMS